MFYYMKRQDGQFVPLSAMVMLTIVVFLVAVTDLYTVTRAKLRVQNLADAAALNIASQEASAINKVIDINESLNHLIQGVPQNQPGQAPDCAHLDPHLIPPISCAGSNSWHFIGSGDAKNYAGLIQRYNEAQKLFIQTYNNFIGAQGGTTSNAAARGSLQDILKADIPDLADPTIQIYVWNNFSDEASMDAVQKAGGGGPGAGPSAAGSGTVNIQGNRMIPLAFTTNDITVRYSGSFGSINHDTLTHLAGVPNGGDKIGWMQLDNAKMPRLQLDNHSSTPVGAGVLVMKRLSVPVLGSIYVSAKSKAYVVEGTGKIGVPDPINQMPTFLPTYWIKLAGTK